jgi:hypothetical protein
MQRIGKDNNNYKDNEESNKNENKYTDENKEKEENNDGDRGVNEKINLNFLNDNNSSDEIMESLVNSLSISPQKQSQKESKR